MFTKEDIKGYKERLKQELKETEKWLKDHSEGLTLEELSGYDQSHERAAAIVARKKDHERREETVEDIKAALERISNGTFGICVYPGCGKPIEDDRLKISPIYKRHCECEVKHLKGLLEKNRQVRVSNGHKRKKTKKAIST